ncbi:aldo/keto reductase [Acinetobacter sp. Ac_5812]|uniref:aldo/keto reductase n=1 Tax=Acinetobacter sp. Ac_5812 TaxID=1848937 RepID=UPI00148FA196|nr:aldo/keto reductase [Acinetobacter sp. Ac_5812]NNP69395.1 hypothetical protein [Acinetobacter sp. Ac_5812]
MKSVVILQARTNSSRLPGKVLLHLRGFPLVVLAAKRAGNTGRNVIVTTSDEKTDDMLYSVVHEYGIQCYRGSLNNTLNRIVSALEDYDDQTLVFRLTADNVVPDGRLLDELEQSFHDSGVEYLCCNGEQSGLPYGMSVELTRLSHLREADRSTSDKFDLEHVTPFIRRKFGETYFRKYESLNLGNYRCTVDCLDDYLMIQQLFKEAECPISVVSFDLAQQLKNLGSYQPIDSNLAKKLVLGTAQLGLSYGITNKVGKVKVKCAEEIIKMAISNGAASIDTARAYGSSEEVLGNVLKTGWEGRARTITKLSPLNDIPLNATTYLINALVDESIYQSCTKLRVPKLDIFMLHRAEHLDCLNGGIWARLLTHKESGLLNTLGVSVQTPAELKRALNNPAVEIIQMPYNVLDWRWDQLIPEIITKKRERDLKIHVRSSLLQGLLTSKDIKHWHKANVSEAESILRWFDQQQCIMKTQSNMEFCLKFVNSLEWVDGIVIGVESLEQLQENIKILCLPHFSAQELELILSSRPKVEEITLNPALWS